MDARGAFWLPTYLDRLVDGARSAPARAGRTRVVAVDGPSGSGKSTLARELSGAMGCAPVVRLDDIYPGWGGLDEAVPRLLEWVLDPLARGERARYRRYDWNAEQYAGWCDVPVCDVLVVEGCSSGARPCAPYLSFLVWLEAPREVRLARGLARDGDAYRPHWQRWADQEAAHFAREGTRERADVRLTTG